MSDSSTNLLERDLEHIVTHNADDFETLRDARLFITGGTGFVGTWLLESFTWANRRLALGAKAVVLTRDPGAFRAAASHLAADPSIELVRGDVRDLHGINGHFDAVVHAATPASAQLNDTQPQVMLDTIVDGTRAVLELARCSGAIPVLLTSSGAVYGRQPADLSFVDEAYAGAPDTLDPRNAYHESKRIAELLCAIAGRSYGLLAKIARLFAFVGPYLPLDRHFAIGNFMRDALLGKTIEITGDGTPIRTYLYAADMTSWLWRILVKGLPSRAYNVGSERTISIREAAELVALSAGRPGAYCVRTEAVAGKPSERYACSTHRARTELELLEWTSLKDGVRRTLEWQRLRTGLIVG